ncbi:MAG: DUF6350 family protein, partial [Bifidobacteriaceae bacterium]|nr:DUF6350 family protein [Bifidobacteriaceae bacterium]
AGWWLQRQWRAAWWRHLIGAALTGLFAAAALAALVALAGGAAGPGRLATVGTSFWPLAGWLWLEIGVGAAIGACLLARPWRSAGAPATA